MHSISISAKEAEILSLAYDNGNVQTGINEVIAPRPKWDKIHNVNVQAAIIDFFGKGKEKIKEVNYDH
jgi:hypothetical protein